MEHFEGCTFFKNRDHFVERVLSMSRCQESVVVFSTATLEKIIDTPESVLENEEQFWENERSQKLTKLLAENIGHEIQFEKWRENMRSWAAIPLEERSNHVFMQNARKIIDSKEVFLEKAIPHICSFLPEDAEIDITIHFTAFIPSRAFAHQDIVINVSAPYWNDNADNVINTLVHEIFHVGYGYYRDIRQEPPIENEALYNTVDILVNEGICTYVAYKALPVFPAPDEKDYQLLENFPDVQQLFDDLNSVLTQIGKVSSEELQQLVYKKCVIGRAFYPPGAYMAKIIDEEKGRDTLIQKLIEGPGSFIKLYNTLVKKKLQVQFDE